MRLIPRTVRARVIVAITVVMTATAIVFVALPRGAAGVPMATVTRGDYTDVIEIRGEVRPVKTTYVSAPRNAGELLIVKISKNGTAVKAGEIVAEFDAVTVRRTIQEKQSELRSAIAERDQAKAQARITLEERAAAVRRASFDLQRAKLGLGNIEFVSKIDAERAKLAVTDAEHKLREAEAAEASARASIDADFKARERRIEKTQGDLDRAQSSMKAMQVVAPTGGTVSILPNYRSSTPMGTPQEYRPGDKTFSGALILELPDLTSVFLVARIEEADRGPLQVGQTAIIRADAVPDREYQAVVSDISLLARVDFMGGWPPAKLFDLKLTLKDPDDRLRAGMSAGARIAIGQISDVLLVPTKSIATVGGQTMVYRATRRGLEPVAVQVVRQGRDQAAIRGGVNPGDQIAATPPADAAGGAGGRQ